MLTNNSNRTNESVVFTSEFRVCYPVQSWWIVGKVYEPCPARKTTCSSYLDLIPKIDMQQIPTTVLKRSSVSSTYSHLGYQCSYYSCWTEPGEGFRFTVRIKNAWYFFSLFYLEHEISPNPSEMFLTSMWSRNNGDLQTLIRSLFLKTSFIVNNIAHTNLSLETTNFNPPYHFHSISFKYDFFFGQTRI